MKRKKSAPLIKHPNISSSTAPVPHTTSNLPVPQPPIRDQSCPAKTAKRSNANTKTKENGSSSSSITSHSHKLYMKGVPIILIKKYQ